MHEHTNTYAYHTTHTHTVKIMGLGDHWYNMLTLWVSTKQVSSSYKGRTGQSFTTTMFYLPR